MKRDYIENIPNAERRFYTGTVEVREDGDKKKTIQGYAAVFNKDSENFGGWIERVDPKAFDDVMKDDVRGLFNHDSNIVLGRAGKSMRLSVDSVGLKYEIDLPETRAAQDLYESVKRGDISESSFGFITKEHSWETNKDKSKPSVRTILKLERLFDVGPVTFAAYPDTKVAARSLDTLNNSGNTALVDHAEMDQSLMKLQLNKLKS